MKIKFNNQKVLVTGGTRGIGKEIAKRFSKLGAKVVITGTSKKRPSDVNYKINYETLKVTPEANWRKRVDNIVEKYNGFDICINNAGINKVSKIFDIESVDIDNILLTNLNAPIYISSIVSKKMKENCRGSIINIASIFGVVTKSGRNAYTASKSGLIGVTKTMAIDLGQYSIKVNSVSPGFVDTELTRQNLGEAGMKEMVSRIPMNRLADVNDIVPTILFLSSKHNTYITGQNIVVDGGFIIE